MQVHKYHKPHFNRELLYNRHRLSHQEIDDFLNEKESRNYISEKIEQMTQLHEFLAVTDRFRNAGITFISIKGPLLSFRLYKDATYRRYHDFDFLIGLPDIDKALDILQEMGYESDLFKWPKNLRRKQLIINHNKHILLFHTNKNTCIELHWKLFDTRIAQPQIVSQVILENQTFIEFAGRRFLVFNPEFELLYLIIHGGLGNWFRLKWLVDIHQIMQFQSIKIDKFIELSYLLKANRMIALCNSMMAEFYPNDKKLPVDGKMLSHLINFSLERIYHTSDYEHYTIFELLKSYRFSLIAFPGYKYKYDVLKDLMFYKQAINNENIPAYSIVYYFLGPTKRIFSRIRLIFKPKEKL